MIEDAMPSQPHSNVWRLLACRGWLASASALVLALVLAFALGANVAQAQQFSAEIVTQRNDARDAASVRVGRLSARDGRVRIETADFPDGFFLADTSAATPTAWFIRPAARLYMEARQSSRLTQWFVPVDPDAPCPQWQAMARLAGQEIGKGIGQGMGQATGNGGEGEWHCEALGEETIEGRSTVAFRVSTATGGTYSGWIDRQLKFPLRIKADDGNIFALEHIRDEPQPAASFELPANYRKFSPETLIERVKQSDVWVSRPDGAPRP